ncbi:MAG: energy transducer TonB [Deltaproteobacteria bacterium]|nr:energy transducer TonB [Deltaproteobacteria bacterium]
MLGYEAQRTDPDPWLTVRTLGDGTGQVIVTKIGESAPILRCSKASCRVSVKPGTRVRITALVGETKVQDKDVMSTFAGYRQVPMRTPDELKAYLGDPLETCIVKNILDAVEEDSNPYDCSFSVKADTDVAALFDLPQDMDIELQVPTPTPATVADMIKPLVPKAPEPVAPIDPEKLDEKELQVAIKPPPPPPQIKPPEQKPPEQKPPDKKVLPPPPNKVMVEVDDDKNVVKEDVDADKLSDKNRNVAEETRATQTNLEKEMKGQDVASRESDDRTSKEVGGPDAKIRQNVETEATTDQRDKETPKTGDDSKVVGVKKGDEGENGDEGKGDDKPLLAMRDIGGRGSLTEQGKGGGKIGKRGTPGLNTPLAFEDYQRIMGKDKIEEEREVAARKASSQKGRWEKKLAAVRSALENFVPDVRPGNQTALKTRAHPYALYVARMHRRIHELWGFGFLEQLDDKPADYPLNNPDLWVNLELSVNPDGTLHKVTIAKTSGKTEFDVAAIDTVISAAPYETTPEAIRSVDGRIYLRWGFYRNWRQCGTFNVEPYILTEVPEDNGVGVLDDGAMVKNTAKSPGSKKQLPPVGNKTVTPDDGHGKDAVNPSTSVTDKQALHSANLWVSAFATAQVDKLVKYSTVPFYAGGKIAAQTQGDLKEMYSGLIVESGPMKDWKLLTPGEYGGALPEGSLVLQVRTAKEAFAVVLTRTKSGDFRATQIARN